MLHSLQSDNMSAMTKNGSQQMAKTPVMMANVWAALRSRFASSIWRRLASLWYGFGMLESSLLVELASLPAVGGFVPAIAKSCADVVNVIAIDCCWCAVLATSCETVEISPIAEIWDCLVGSKVKIT